MAFTMHDMLERMNSPEHGQDREVFSVNEKPRAISAEEMKKLFPNVKLSQSPNVIYAPVTMCNSLPTINKRGRCFTPRVMGKSHASALHNLVDIEHELADHGRPGDNICGGIVAVSFGNGLQWKDEMASEGSEWANIPASPIPMYALLNLFTRHSTVPKIVEQYMNGGRTWKTSMECGHDWNEAHFLYQNEFIPLPDAPDGMRECVGRTSVKRYKDKELAVALGGVDKAVDYWGIAMTLSPADATSDVLAMISGASRELASRGKIFLPAHLYNFKRSDAEVASTTLDEDGKIIYDDEQEVDKKFAELASISVIGQTEPGAEDGHSHDILSDMVVVPNGGHGHSLRNFNIKPGTKPTLTGYTDNHHAYTRDGNGAEKSSVHMHVLNIDLSKKATPPKSASSTMNGKGTNAGVGPSYNAMASLNVEDDVIMAELANVDSFVSLSRSLFGDPNTEGKKTMANLFNKLDGLLAKISTGNTAAGSGGLSPEVASTLAEVRAELQKSGVEDEIKTRVQAEIASQVAAGELVNKADHEKAMEDQKKKLEDEANAKAAISKKVTERRAMITAIGVDVESEIPGGTPGMTIGQQTDAIPADQMGDTMFNTFFAGIKALAEANKAQNQATDAANAAAADAVKAKEQASKKKPFLLAGGGETASTAGTPAPLPAGVVGRGKSGMTALR